MSNKINYVTVPLAKLDAETDLPSDVYIKIKEKYIKYKERGDCISGEKYSLFMAKKVKYVFITDDQAGDFFNWMKEIKDKQIEESVLAVGEENRDLVVATADIKEIIFETFSDEHLSSETVDILQKQSKDFIAKISKKTIPVMALAKLMKHSQSVADHSANVANLSVYLAMAVGHATEFELEQMYTGAILHDLGKVKIDPKILENPNDSLYSHAINQHPVEAVKMLKKMDNVHPDALSIVLQHHEFYNGAGYPQGLKADQISEYARIASIANAFDNICIENFRYPESERYKKAIKYLEIDNGKQFDPKLAKRCIDALKLAYGGFHRDRADVLKQKNAAKKSA